MTLTHELATSDSLTPHKLCACYCDFIFLTQVYIERYSKANSQSFTLYSNVLLTIDWITKVVMLPFTFSKAVKC